MIMNMKKRNVIELNSILNKLKDFGGTKFKYGVLRNINALKNHIKALEKLESDIKLLVSEFEEDKNQLIINLGKPDEKGGIYIDQNDKDVMEEFNSEFSKLLEKHKESIENYNTEVTEYQEILEEEVEDEIKFRKININECPEDGITFSELEKLSEFEIISE